FAGEGNQKFLISGTNHQQRRFSRPKLNASDGAHLVRVAGSHVPQGAAHHIADVRCSLLQRHAFGSRNLQLAAHQMLRVADGIHAAKLENKISQVRPEILQLQHATPSLRLQSMYFPALGKTVRKVCVEFYGDFAPPPLRLEHAGDGDELFGYSRISRVKRLRSFMPAALRMVRMERAVRPCFPMTLPRSLGATRSSKTVTCSPSTD